jgi:hypothetical protein
MTTDFEPPAAPLLDFDLDIPKPTFREEDRIVWVTRKEEPTPGEKIPTITWSTIKVRMGDLNEGEKYYLEYDAAWEASFEMSLIDEILVE